MPRRSYRSYSRGSGIGDLIPASGEGRALVEVKGHIGGKKGGSMRRRYSTERRFRNPVNYISWPVVEIQDVTPVPLAPADKWYLFDVGSNDNPNVWFAASMYPDTPQSIRYGSSFDGNSYASEVPENSPMRPPINARPLWTVGKIMVTIRGPDPTLFKVGIFKTPLNMPFSAAASVTPTDGMADVAGNVLNWFWRPGFERDAVRGMRRNPSIFQPIWEREHLFKPTYSGNAGVASSTATHVFPVKIRHKDGEALNTDNTAYQVLIGSRNRGGSIVEDGGDIIVRLRTSYVV